MTADTAQLRKPISGTRLGLASHPSKLHNDWQAEREGRLCFSYYFKHTAYQFFILFAIVQFAVSVSSL